MSDDKLSIFLALNAEAFKQGLKASTVALKQMPGQVSSSFKKMGADFNTVMGVMHKPVQLLTGKVAQLGATLGTVFTAGKYLKIAEEYAGLNARLQLVTGSATELRNVQNELYALSQRTGTNYAANANTYTKLATALRDAGAGTKEILSINEVISQSIVIAGSSAAEASSFLLQFGQAMGSGILQGDEFRSMMESNSYFAKALASALDTDIAGLRKMASEGKLTTEVIREAVPKMTQQINDDFAKMPLTIGRAMTMLSNAFSKIVNGSNKAGGATGKIAEAIRSFVEYLDSHGKQIEDFIVKVIGMGSSAAKTAWEWKRFIAGFAGFVIVGGIIGKVTTAVSGMVSAFKLLGGLNLVKWLSGIVTTLKGVNIAALGLKGTIGALSGVFLAWEIGFKVGSFLNNFGIVRKAGIAMAGGITKALLRAKKAWTWLKGGDTDAVQREIEQAEQIYAEMFAEVDRDAKQAATSHKKIATAAKQSAQEQASAQKKATDQMKKDYKSFVDEVARLNDEIAGRQKSLKRELREMYRSDKPELFQISDLKKEGGEYIAEAKRLAKEAQQALANGNSGLAKKLYSEALQYADDAKDVYKQLDSASGGEAIETAMKGVKKAGELAIEILKQQEEAAKKTAEELNKQSGGSLFEDLKKDAPELAAMFDPVKEDLEDLAGKSEEYNRKWTDAWNKFLKTGGDAIYELDTKLSQLVKDRHIKVYVTEVVKKASSSAVSSVRSLAASSIPQVSTPDLAAAGAASVSAMSSSAASGSAGGDTYNVYVTGGISERDLARKIVDAIKRAKEGSS